MNILFVFVLCYIYLIGLKIVVVFKAKKISTNEMFKTSLKNLVTNKKDILLMMRFNSNKETKQKRRRYLVFNFFNLQI